MRKEVMILSGKYLRLVDQDGDVIYEMNDTEVFVLVDQIKKLQRIAKFQYETDEIDPLLTTLDRWLNAQSH
jgi:hypothetical protein